MSKKILLDYIDACELIKEIERDIRKLEKRKSTVIKEIVKGSMEEFPFAEKHFHIEGAAYACADDERVSQEKGLLSEQKSSADKIKIQAEEFMRGIPARMQRIIRLKIFEQMSWEQTAQQMGRKSTADSIRKEYERFFEEK